MVRAGAKAYHARSMSINHPSALSAIAAGLAKTAGVVVALGVVYPHVAAALAHTANAIAHLTGGSRLTP